MITMCLIALCNGVVISMCRVVNGRLAQDTDAFHAAYWNHLVGLVVLSIICLVSSSGISTLLFNAPWWAWSGGIIGALFVAINAFVVTKLGATLTALLIISGQLFSGTVISLFQQGFSHGMAITPLIGCVLVFGGIVIIKSDFNTTNTKETT